MNPRDGLPQVSEADRVALSLAMLSGVLFSSTMNERPSVPSPDPSQRKPRHGVRGRALNQEAMHCVANLIGAADRAPDA